MRYPKESQVPGMKASAMCASVCCLVLAPQNDSHDRSAKAKLSWASGAKSGNPELTGNLVFLSLVLDIFVH